MRDSALTTVRIPCLDNRYCVIDNETTDLVEFSWAESMIPRQLHGRQPEFRMPPISSDVHVRWFVTVETVEKEPVWPRNTWNLRHSALLRGRRSQVSAFGDLP